MDQTHHDEPPAAAGSWVMAARDLRPMLPAPASVLEAVAVTLRRHVGPQVGQPFAQTQAFMAAVILEKLAGQLREEPFTHERDGQERNDLLPRLRALCPQPPPRLGRAMGALTEEDTDVTWCALVEALYAERDRLGPDFDRLLSLVRIALRSRLDRVLVFAR